MDEETKKLLRDIAQQLRDRNDLIRQQDAEAKKAFQDNVVEEFRRLNVNIERLLSQSEKAGI